MREIAFDESGNSGQNLLDPAQPVYTLASVARTEAEVADEVAALLEASAFTELKFSAMRGSEKGRAALDALFDSGLLDPDSARVVPVQKVWMVAGKMVDILWEPGAANSNYFYASGMHRQLADVLYHQGPREAGAETWARWQRAFIAVVRRPRETELITDLEAALAAVKAASAGKPVGILFEPVPDDASALAALIPHGRDELDPAVSGLLEQIDHWSERLGEPFSVVHDDSDVVARWRQIYLRFSDQEMEPSSFELGDIHFNFPLYGIDIETVDSRHSAAVQLADVLSGAVMWCLREKLRGRGAPSEWWGWGLGRFIDFAQGAPDFLLGLVGPAAGYGVAARAVGAVPTMTFQEQ
jgi:hypothetical protein